MSTFVRFIGSLLIFLWVAMEFLDIDVRNFFPNGDYSSHIDDLMNNKWLLLVGGITLSIIGTVTKVKKNRNNRNNRRDHRFNDVSGEAKVENYNSDSNTNDNFVKKDFIKEQNSHKAEQFVSRQEGKLKELALKVDWTPLCSGGSNFKTTSLKRVSASRLETSKSFGGIAFAGIFAIVGLGIMTGMSYTIYQENGFSFELLFPILFGGVFAAVGIGMLIWPRPRIFDLRQGWFWAGSKSLRREKDFFSLKKSARLSDIAAIQIIAERVSGSKGGSYTSWEINLVSKNGERLNVMDHGSKNSIIDDGQFLGDFLGVPVWENT